MNQAAPGSFAAILDQSFSAPRDAFQPMPEGTGVDMGVGAGGIPLIDPQLFDSGEYFRNPHPYYKIMREHYPVYYDKLHNAYYLTRYD